MRTKPTRQVLRVRLIEGSLQRAERDGLILRVKLQGDFRDRVKEYGHYSIRRESVAPWNPAGEIMDTIMLAALPLFIFTPDDLGPDITLAGLFNPLQNTPRFASGWKTSETGRTLVKTETVDVINRRAIGQAMLELTTEDQVLGDCRTDQHGDGEVRIPYDRFPRSWLRTYRQVGAEVLIRDSESVIGSVRLPPEIVRALLYAEYGELEVDPSIVADDIERVQFAAQIIDAAGVLSMVLSFSNRLETLKHELSAAYRSAKTAHGVLTARWTRRVRSVLGRNLVALGVDLVVGELVIWSLGEYLQNAEVELELRAKEIVIRDLREAGSSPLPLEVRVRPLVR